MTSKDQTFAAARWPFVENRLGVIQELVRPGQLPWQLCHGHFFHDGWLWASSDFVRVSLDGKKRELLANPRKQSREPFYPHECFQVVGIHQILIADAHGIWLATLRPGGK